MTLVEQIQQTQILEQEFQKDPKFLELQAFYQEMLAKGLIRKQEYTLPPLDTTGRKLYEEFQKRSRSAS